MPKSKMHMKTTSVYLETANQKQRNLQFRAAPPESFLLLVPKQSPQNLPTRTLGNSFDEPDTALEPLVSSLVLLDVLLDRLSGCCIVGTSFSRLDDDGLGDFACCVVGNGDNGAVADGRVGEDVGFEFGGGNLQAL